MNNYLQKIISVKHWTENLFSFKVIRPKDFKFKSGEFVMIGLPDRNEKPIMRAYSICSPNWSEELEFYSIIVKNGPLTSKLKDIKPNDKIYLMKKPTGTLILDALLPGKRLFLFSTGTGFAPFASLIRDPETYEKFSKIIVTHTCRKNNELEYSKSIIIDCKNEMLNEFINNNLIYYPTTTRDISKYNGRITNQIVNQEIFKNLNLNSFNKDHDRIMICGSLEFNNELKNILCQNNFIEGATNKPGEYVLEKAFVG